MTFGFSTYKFEKIASKGDILQNVSVSKGTKSHVNLVFENDSGALVKKSSSSNITHEIILEENINAPIFEGDILGKMNYYLDNELITSVNLIAEKDVPKINFINMFSHLSNTWVNLLRNL